MSQAVELLEDVLDRLCDLESDCQAPEQDDDYAYCGFCNAVFDGLDYPVHDDDCAYGKAVKAVETARDLVVALETEARKVLREKRKPEAAE